MSVQPYSKQYVSQMLDKFLKSSKLSMSHFALRIGISKGYLSKVRKNKIIPKLTNSEKILLSCGVSVADTQKFINFVQRQMVTKKKNGKGTFAQNYFTKSLAEQVTEYVKSTKDNISEQLIVAEFGKQGFKAYQQILNSQENNDY